MTSSLNNFIVDSNSSEEDSNNGSVLFDMEYLPKVGDPVTVTVFNVSFHMYLIIYFIYKYISVHLLMCMKSKKTLIRTYNFASQPG